MIEIPEHWPHDYVVRHLLCEILVHQELQHIELTKELRKFMAAIDDLNAAVSQLSTDVQALIAKPTGGTSDTQIAAVTSQVTALDQTVKTALGT